MFHRTPSGFMLDFSNGWTASVQFSAGNYCTNRNASYNPFTDAPEFLESNTAEIAAWRTDSKNIRRTKWYMFEDNQEVKGWQNVASVMEFLNIIAKLDEPIKGTISTGHEDLDVWFNSKED